MNILGFQKRVWKGEKGERVRPGMGGLTPESCLTESEDSPAVGRGSVRLWSEMEGAIVAFTPVLSWDVSWKAEARLLGSHGLVVP